MSVLTAVAALAAVAPTAAQADDSSTLTVVGTSDVYDSNLVQSVIKPGFEKAYPGVTLNYVSKGTGAAITYAEAGSASALIVHAASLENQFVADGYSAEKYGRAIFYGDYVLLGPANDPAGVLTSDKHDIVGAFEKIAAAGAAGHANFVSRGGTPGTTVQEHAIWKLTNGVTTCTVSDANGGGTTPSTATGACPSDITQAKTPSWYQATGLTQGPNVINADACNYSGGGCYVFTDRGTFQYLESQKSLSKLGIVTRDNAASARGGNTLLVNSFHAYAINPAKFAGNSNVQINSTAAHQFLTWLTSPTAQAAVGNYLAKSSDGPPFLPDAAPVISTSAIPKNVYGGGKITITGTVRNVVPGTPALSGVKVVLRGPLTLPGSTSNVFATATTNSAGRFSISYQPLGTRAYVTLSVGAITKIENAGLKPQFGDLLSATTTARSARVTVHGRVSITSLDGDKGSVTGSVALLPGVHYQRGLLQLYAARVGSKAALHYVAQRSVARGQNSRSFTFALPRGKWRVQFRYVNNGVLASAASGVHTRTVR
ncbi:substrate-binding domain-containing protein [uncultured Jatrophihabitans sp.]|uniref:substrate-binding domain-containing protein n=1 Tax=uncultured Jatrophihabitans sp. TaxID=1610747 RepID=UPI0035CA0888